MKGDDYMPKKLNLLNQIFGELTVIDYAPNKSNGRTAWKCKCSCGNEIIVGTKELRNGDTKSCGCLRDKLLTINLIGQRFGKLVVIARAKNNVNYEGAFWECQCDCGNTIITSGKRLRSGHTTSCGCQISKGESLIEQLLTENHIIHTQQFTFKDCITENGFVCKFDFAIFDKTNSLKCLIEYDGIQHFEESQWDLEKQQIRDNIKNNYCKQHQIPLVRIPYYDFNKINIKYLLERVGEACQNIVDT